jgi:hypothetical protein
MILIVKIEEFLKKTFSLTFSFDRGMYNLSGISFVFLSRVRKREVSIVMVVCFRVVMAEYHRRDTCDKRPEETLSVNNGGHLGGLAEGKREKKEKRLM